MGLRELKETAHRQFVRGKFAQCARTYQQVLRLAPRDPNMHVRHAEACRRAGERLQAIASYRAAAELLLELGCAARARGALKAALELEPRNRLLQEAIARLGPHHEEPFSPGAAGCPEELPMLPPLESGLDPVPPPSLAPSPQHAAGPEAPRRTLALPPLHRPLPAARSTPPPAPPVLLPRPARSMASPTEAPFPPRLHSNTAVTPPPPPVEALMEAARTMPADPQAAMPALPCGATPHLEVRRLSPSALAFRGSPQDSWAVIRSHTPLELHLVEDLAKLPPLMRDMPAEQLEPSADEETSRTVRRETEA